MFLEGMRRCWNSLLLRQARKQASGRFAPEVDEEVGADFHEIADILDIACRTPKRVTVADLPAQAGTLAGHLSASRKAFP